MCIAWTSLFHAIFEKRKIKYFYRKESNRLEYEKVDGEYKAWELSTCCKEYYKDITTPARANLETLIKLRNKIEHRFLPELDSHVFGECQSCLFNYEKLLISEFGIEHAINSSLAFGLQFSEVYEEQQINSMKSMKCYIKFFQYKSLNSLNSILKSSNWLSVKLSLNFLAFLDHSLNFFSVNFF